MRGASRPTANGNFPILWIPAEQPGIQRPELADAERWVFFDVFLTVAALIGDSARLKVNVVANNSGTPGSAEKLREGAFASYPWKLSVKEIPLRLRRSVVEHPFSTIKYRIFRHPRLLLRGRQELTPS